MLGTLLHEVKHWMDWIEGQLPKRTKTDENVVIDKIKKELTFENFEDVKGTALRKLKKFNESGSWDKPVTKERINEIFTNILKTDNRELGL